MKHCAHLVLQLQLYGFGRQAMGPYRGSYQHPSFMQDSSAFQLLSRQKHDTQRNENLRPPIFQSWPIGNSDELATTSQRQQSMERGIEISENHTVNENMSYSSPSLPNSAPLQQSGSISAYLPSPSEWNNHDGGNDGDNKTQIRQLSFVGMKFFPMQESDGLQRCMESRTSFVLGCDAW